MIDRVIPINKPIGLTSHDVVDRVRRKLGIRRVGHAGTLDPFACGVLIILVGQATKRFEEFKTLEKEYRLTILLGKETDTLDPEGVVLKSLETRQLEKANLSSKTIKKALERFQGGYLQEVPRYSAVKYQGKPLYWYARRGIDAKPPHRRVKISQIRLLEIIRENRYPKIVIEVTCGQGTYMRSLARDIGHQLNLPAMASGLVRTRVGKYHITECFDLDDLGSK